MSKKKTDFRPRLNGNKKAVFNHFTKKENRILVIGDLHAPFDLDGYFEHCKEVYAKYNCNKVVFIGDVIGNISSIVAGLGEQGLVGLIVALIVIHILGIGDAPAKGK